MYEAMKQLEQDKLLLLMFSDEESTSSIEIQLNKRKRRLENVFSEPSLKPKKRKINWFQLNSKHNILNIVTRMIHQISNTKLYMFNMYFKCCFS